MNKVKFTKFILLSFLTVFLVISTGCFDVKREIVMNPDGSGDEKIYVTLDKEFFERMNILATSDATGKWKKRADSVNDNTMIEDRIKMDMGRVGGTSVKDVKVTTNADGTKEVFLQYHFDEPAVLLKVIKECTFSWSNQLPVQFSTLKFQYDEGDLLFKHTTRKAERSFDDELMNSVFSPTYASKKVTYSIEFPFDIKESNAVTSAGRTLTWEMTFENIMFNQQTDTASMVKDPTLELTYAEKIDRSIGKVSQKENPLIRVQVYNRNKEPVKIGTGVVLKDGLLVTNFELMNLIEGAGFFSVILPSDSLAGIDDMTEKDLDQKQNLVFLRYGAPDKFKPIKYAAVSSAKYGDKVKLFYYPNTLSSIVYSMDGMMSAVKKWTKNTSLIEIKPNKPISLDGGAVFNEAGEFLGMITKAFDGEVGKIYLVPAEYIKSQIPSK
ncbi:MAG: trypsin-like peptidase domain-containing protein [Ignavibacteria bacterium]|nr:trypsin-like peptidase domain-containing protein [Ignavibacteria bacterium]